MAHAEHTVTIERPVPQVYAFVLDGANCPLWRPSVLDVQLLPGKPLGTGAVYKQGLKGPTGRIDGDYELVEVKPQAWIKFQVVAGPARPTGTYQFEAVGRSTRLTFTLDFKAKGLAKLMDGIIHRTMQQEVATLDNLKTYMEAH